MAAGDPTANSSSVLPILTGSCLSASLVSSFRGSREAQASQTGETPAPIAKKSSSVSFAPLPKRVRQSRRDSNDSLTSITAEWGGSYTGSDNGEESEEEEDDIVSKDPEPEPTIGELAA